MKSSTISVLEEDYVTVARAKGLKEGRITTSYVGRNAALPLFTLLTISIGFVVGGSVLIETIFQYQGIGFILPNEVSYEPLFKYAVTIDEVERQTGLDFFQNLLSNSEERAIESQVNIDLWEFNKKKYELRTRKWNED